MADVPVTTTTAAPFIPEVWGQKAVGKIAGTLALGNAVARDFADAAQQVGDIVNVPVLGAITSGLKSSGGDLEAQAPSDATIQVTLNKHRYASFMVPDEVTSEAMGDPLVKYVEAAAVQIAEDMEIDGLTAAYTGFTTNTVGAAGTAFTEANFLVMRQALSVAKVPQGMPKYAFLHPKAVTTALAIARLSEADKLGIPDGPIREGAIGKLHGFIVVESQYVVETTGPTAQHNVVLAREAMTLAMRPLKTPRSPGVSTYVAAGVPGTPTEGIGVRVTMAYDIRKGGDRCNVEALYGWKVLRETFGGHYTT